MGKNFNIEEFEKKANARRHKFWMLKNPIDVDKKLRLKVQQKEHANRVLESQLMLEKIPQIKRKMRNELKANHVFINDVRQQRTLNI